MLIPNIFIVYSCVYSLFIHYITVSTICIYSKQRHCTIHNIHHNYNICCDDLTALRVIFIFVPNLYNGLIKKVFTNSITITNCNEKTCVVH